MAHAQKHIFRSFKVFSMALPALTLNVVEGTSSYGKILTIEGRTTSIGGRASNADIEFPDLPNGEIYVEFIPDGDDWTIMEKTIDSDVRYSGRLLERRNVVRSGLELTLPGREGSGEVRIRTDLAKRKGTGATTLPRIDPMFATIALAWIIAGSGYLYMSSRDTGPKAPQVVQYEQVKRDVAAVSEGAVNGSDTTPLIDQPETPAQLYRALAAATDSADRMAIQEQYANRIVYLLREGERLRELGLLDQARTNYRTVVDMLPDSQLATTLSALGALSRLR